MSIGRKKLAGTAVVLCLALIAALALAGIGNAKGGTRLGLRASASGALKFNKKKLTAKRGTVTIVMTNPKGSGLTHGIAVEGKGVDKDGAKVGPGHKSTVSVRLKPGKYAFYCPVDGHKAAGMKGTLVVHK